MIKLGTVQLGGPTNCESNGPLVLHNKKGWMSIDTNFWKYILYFKAFESLSL